MPVGKPFNRSQPLGKLMFVGGWTVRDLAWACDINDRTISDYLAGRKPFQPHHLTTLADVFGVDPGVLTGEAPLPGAVAKQFAQV